VRGLREAAGYTQKQFAMLLVTTLDRVKKYERGTHAMNASLWLLARISCDARIRARWAQAIARSNNA
jgi:transcriptional regulator with XRE-family HTH domain